ncbi:MAG: dihydropteroate synthase [Acidobacteria bacterium]|nr:dihydropteroate synthase [Acidobacteriota bacterium]MBI3662884.1 dihydropteroate synthase [Acidobacteriota bacterium]
MLVLGERTLMMGVLNVTPDSFSDGGKFFDIDAAVEQALKMENDGADILDMGGESTRPGSESVTVEEELRRVLPVIERLRGKLRIPISIDTQKAAVAEAAAKAGAEIINDVSALRTDPEIAGVARRHKLPLVLMHMRGKPRTMQKQPFARDVMRDVKSGLREAVARARKMGVAKSQIILDPGIGFGKSYAQNCKLLARLPELARLEYPLLLGTSRKAFIGTILGNAKNPLPPQERFWGTAATVAASIFSGAHIVRVHDVKEMVQVARMADAVVNAR